MKTKILLDTDFLIALFLKSESTHLKAKKIYSKYKKSDFFILNITKFELATVLSRKLNFNETKELLNQLDKSFLNEIRLEKKDEKIIWQEFFYYPKKKISFIDCANLIIAKNMDFKIASFDKFYPKGMRLELELN